MPHQTVDNTVLIGTSLQKIQKIGGMMIVLKFCHLRSLPRSLPII